MKKFFTAFISTLLILMLAGLGGLFGYKEYQSRAGLSRQQTELSEADGDLAGAKETEDEADDGASADSNAEQGEDAARPAFDIDDITCGSIAYDSLDEEDRQLYEEILYTVENHQEEIRLTTLDESRIERAYQALTCDYGGMFWINGYTYTRHTMDGEVTQIDFMPTYLFSREERESYQEYIDDQVEAYFAHLDSEASDYEKVKYIYEMLIYNVKYNLEAEENQNILSVFLYGESVCSGFANAAQYMLTLLDVPCMNVYGVSQDEAHAWNLVYIDGEPYFLDATWGNTASQAIGSCDYTFLNLTSEDLSKTHTIDMLFDVPECTSTAANYYVHEGLMFDSCDDERLDATVRAAYEGGEASISIRLSSDEAYRQTFTYFITQQHISELCPNLSSIQYVENKELRVLTLMW